MTVWEHRMLTTIFCLEIARLLGQAVAHALH